jgi:hypothetical protein
LLDNVRDVTEVPPSSEEAGLPKAHPSKALLNLPVEAPKECLDSTDSEAAQRRKKRTRPAVPVLFRIGPSCGPARNPLNKQKLKEEIQESNDTDDDAAPVSARSSRSIWHHILNSPRSPRVGLGVSDSAATSPPQTKCSVSQAANFVLTGLEGPRSEGAASFLCTGTGKDTGTMKFSGFEGAWQQGAAGFLGSGKSKGARGMKQTPRRQRAVMNRYRS